MALELWQEAFIDKPQDMQVLQKSLQLLRPIVDARVNPVSDPGYYERNIPEIGLINDVLADATNGREFKDCYPDPQDLQFLLLYGSVYQLWLLLRVYVQGASIAMCDPAKAVAIQALFMELTKEPEPEEP